MLDAWSATGITGMAWTGAFLEAGHMGANEYESTGLDFGEHQLMLELGQA
jgi:hypothetical protein